MCMNRMRTLEKERVVVVLLCGCGKIGQFRRGLSRADRELAFQKVSAQPRHSERFHKSLTLAFHYYHYSLEQRSTNASRSSQLHNELERRATDYGYLEDTASRVVTNMMTTTHSFLHSPKAYAMP